jgi:RNA polymerase sigma-70 factor (ECF subfamily)
MHKQQAGGSVPREATDEELLTSGDPLGFGLFYERHQPGVYAYFARRVGRDLAEDLIAETFASALVAQRRFEPGLTPAAGWLYTIAARRLVDFRRRAAVARRTRDLLAQTVDPIAPPSPEIPALLLDRATGLLRHLPREQRDAILAYVVADESYQEIAQRSRASEVSIRQRASRGLIALRAPLWIYRAAHDLAREGREYRFGGGHGKPIPTIQPREPLDCSAATSLLLHRAGLLEPSLALTSRRLANEWGEPGEGRYVTVWANDEHVWIEFNLAHDHDERFDPTPLRSAPDNPWLSGRDLSTRGFTPRHWPDL